MKTVYKSLAVLLRRQHGLQTASDQCVARTGRGEAGMGAPAQGHPKREPIYAHERLKSCAPRFDLSRISGVQAYFGAVITSPQHHVGAVSIGHVCPHH
jgi:hypothetical protein